METLDLLDARLGGKIDEVRPGLILSSLRSLESDHRAYDTEEGRKEHASDLLAALDDLAGTVRDFVSQFPKTRDIVANQLALGLAERPDALREAEKASEDLAGATEDHPMLVRSEIAPAMREPGRSIASSRTMSDRAKQIGLRLLTVANFSSVVAATRKFARDSAHEVAKHGPKAVGKVAAGGVVAGAGLAFGHWAGQGGLTLLLEVADAVGAINAAVGKRGGIFDRLMKAIESVRASEAPAEPAPKAKRAPRKKTTTKKSAAKKLATKRPPVK